MARDRRRPLLSKRVLRGKKHEWAPERHGRHRGRDNRVPRYRVSAGGHTGMWKSLPRSWINPFAFSGTCGSVLYPGPDSDSYSSSQRAS
jgi:hypothetical protein